MTSEAPNEHKEEDETALEAASEGTPLTNRVPQYRRDITLQNVALSAADLSAFTNLIIEVNERAKKLEIARADPGKFESDEDAQRQADEFMPVEYRYTDQMGDSIQGLGELDSETADFPNDMASFYISNTSFPKRAIDIIPLNAVDALIDFKRPNLAVDMLNAPSNPTENRTIINVYGLNEEWVISTENKIQRFFEERKVLRPSIHGSGVYDYFIWLLFLPAMIWMYLRTGEIGREWIENQSMFTNVILAIYVLFLSLFGARLLFQYFRWLFPPVEYFKTSMLGANLHRAVASFFGLGIVGSAAYDILKGMFTALF